MSCRTTHGGKVSLRLARAYSGLTDKAAQALYHSLKREGTGLPDPTEDMIKTWQARQRALLTHADLTDADKHKIERDLHRATADTIDGATFHAWSRIEVRARQEAVMADITTAVDLDPPGSHAAYYDYGKDGRPARVWYASYGSNLHRDRFMTYLEGGTPEGSRTRQPGARDKSAPDGDIPIRFDGRMHFAYMSARWADGGVAFMDTDHAGHALGRAYLITAEQFDDVVAQENGRTPGIPEPTPINDAIADGRAETNKTAVYGTLIHIGDYAGAPVLTFTGSFTAGDALREYAAWETGDEKADLAVAANEPHGNYLRMIATGLNETFGMTTAQQADYLRGCAGAETWARRRLLGVLRRPDPLPMPEPTRTTTYGTSTAYTGAYTGGYTGGWSFGSGAAASKPAATPAADSKPASSTGKSKNTGKGKNAPSAASLAAVGATPRPEPVQEAFDWRDPIHTGRVIRTPARTFSGPPPAPPPVTYSDKATPQKVKRCIICSARDHDMHDCPHLAHR